LSTPRSTRSATSPTCRLARSSTFDSKEDAILGLRDVEITEEAVADHIAANRDADAVESIVRLIVTRLGTSMTDREVRATRLELLLRHPQLMGRQFAQMTRMAERLSTAVTVILKRDPRFDDADSATAELILAVCGSAVRVAVMELAASHSEPDTEQLQQRAIVLVREVVQKLQ
jgi:AcrR family transcriptional regulator